MLQGESAMKIWTLIKKDMILCNAWFFAGIFLTLVAPIYFRYVSAMGEMFMPPLTLLSAVFACNLTVSRVCYIEDNFATKRLLGSMPITNGQYVCCRYVEAFILTLGLMVLALIEGLLLDVSVGFPCIAVFLLIGIVYEGAYLFIFYKWGTNVAQYTLIVLFALLAGAYLVVEKFHLLQDNIFVTTRMGAILIFIGVIVYGCLMWASCKVLKIL